MADEAKRVSQQRASGPPSHFIATPYGFMQIIEPSWTFERVEPTTEENYQAATNYMKSRLAAQDIPYATYEYDRETDTDRIGAIMSGGFWDDPAIDEPPEEKSPWADPEHDVKKDLTDLGEALGGVASRTVTEDDDD